MMKNRKDDRCLPDRYVVDTNILLRNPEVATKYQTIILACVLRELEKHQNSRDEELRQMSREALRKLDDSNSEFDWRDYKVSLNGLDGTYADNIILQYAIDNGCGIITNDRLLRLKAKGHGVEVVVPKEPELYTGCMDRALTSEELSLVYQEPHVNHLGLLANQYLIVRNANGDVKDKFKWTANGLEKVKKKTITSKWAGKVKALNLEQELYMDMLHDPTSTIKAVTGNFGSGKDYLALSYFLELVDKGTYKKIIWIRNNIEANHTKPLGFLPGSQSEKLSVYADLIGDYVGDKGEMNKLITDGKIELVHTGYLRGRDFRNSVIYCSEVQNTTPGLLGLIVSRASSGSVVFLNGDLDQVDGHISKHNSGLYAAISRFKGNPIFAHVQLKKTERSEAANLANLLR